MLTVENVDVRRNVELPRGNVLEQRALAHSVRADEAVPAAEGDRQRRFLEQLPAAGCDVEVFDLNFNFIVF